MSENFSELAVSMPFDKEAEQSLLGSVLVDNQCMDTVSGIVKPDYFYLPAHRAIYSSMLSMFMGGHSAIDPVIIADALVKENLYDLSGGKQYLLQLAQIVPSTANVESYARIVREKYYLRRLIERRIRARRVFGTLVARPEHGAGRGVGRGLRHGLLRRIERRPIGHEDEGGPGKERQLDLFDQGIIAAHLRT